MRWFSRFFSSHKCLVYIAIGHEAYARVAAKLQQHGVSFRTKSPLGNVWQHASNTLPPRSELFTYEIYVKPEDEAKAHQAIHR
ncbi:hypothetical protein NDK47_09475 [Brevibacillus ruminantium]|uniref:DUF2007 domain-containing protein n=1 Tax=Brevibacillus ruminantium TaxID=2950604 RepID=A0ABY4WSB7_9BACL|nr:hypothetical protein [Brevibacillus ruminantium]USG67481.1 hypothetical protein NDK47_09475 [Brevibacillus ruminantium]